ncbi:MAG TPA: SRPBCC domain-containing protein [Dongiaceae bacterium]|nr:SRPBCC domain-containing protein [Dongiaceae bacterium]
MTVPDATFDLTFDTSLAAPPERVFAALTEGRHVARWFCDDCTSEPREGGSLVMRWTRPGSSVQPFEAVWTAFSPPLACAYQGGHSGYPDGNAGAIEFTLLAAGAGTLLHVRHTLPDRAGYGPIAARFQVAWPRALVRLAAYLTPST